MRREPENAKRAVQAISVEMLSFVHAEHTVTGFPQAPMTIVRLTFAAAILLASGCAEETPPHTVEDFMTDRILLEATMVRCGQDRSSGRYDPTCVTAREAVDRIAAAEARAKREALEAESERKREALRRARDAADERRRQAEEAERQRRQAEEFGTFEPLPDEAGELTDDDSTADELPPGEEPADQAVVPPEEPPVAPAEEESAAPDFPKPKITEGPPGVSGDDQTAQQPPETTAEEDPITP